MFQVPNALLFLLMLPSDQVVPGFGKKQTFYFYKWMVMLKRFTFRKEAQANLKNVLKHTIQKV